ncbi:MAG: amidohydrolase [Gammaproteobacteria bacterium]|nr:amidohydrolase [Gammaproteobacteria bacterium]
MTLRLIVLLISAGFAVGGCSQSEKPVASVPADFVLTNGQVKTPDGWATALAIANGEIVAVGDDGSVERFVEQGTEVMDLAGSTVLPGFHDMHVHPVFGGMLYSGADHTNCTIEQGLPLDRLLETLAECVKRVSDDEWVTGGQWDAIALGEVPHRSHLDSVTGNIPVLINDTSGHSAWANSRALAIAGISGETADPPGGIIERDGNGEPTGVLREAGIGMVRQHVPRPTQEIVRQALQWSLDVMLANGITSFTEASNGFVAGAARELDVYNAIADEGLLKHRVRICLNLGADNWMPEERDTESLIENRNEYVRDRLALDCIKIFLDGVPTDSHTAAMLEPYADTVEGRDDEASRYGMLLAEQDFTNDAVTRFDKEGMTVKFHAAGDAAVRAGLDAIEAAREANGMGGPRHDVGHATFIAKDDISRAKPINATFELSPYLFSPSPINDDITKAVGEERIFRVWPFREAIDAGALVVAGSDWAVVPSVNPWLAVEAMVTREEAGGSERSFGKPQAITIAEAIDIFTKNAAQHMGNEDRLGILASGYLADLIVVDQNPYEVADTDLHRTKVLMTFINGEKVYDAGDRQVSTR